MAWVTFTDPEIATFGASNDQLQEAKTTYETVRVDLNDDDRAITESKTAGFLEVYVSSKGDIYGGTMIGARSGEVTSELVLMMHANVRLGKVLDKPFPYPISSRVVQSAARSFSAKRIQSSLAMRVLRFLYH